MKIFPPQLSLVSLLLSYMCIYGPMWCLKILSFLGQAKYKTYSQYHRCQWRNWNKMEIKLLELPGNINAEQMGVNRQENFRWKMRKKNQPVRGDRTWNSLPKEIQGNKKKHQQLSSVSSLYTLHVRIIWQVWKRSYETLSSLCFLGWISLFSWSPQHCEDWNL